MSYIIQGYEYPTLQQAMAFAEGRVMAGFKKMWISDGPEYVAKVWRDVDGVIHNYVKLSGITHNKEGEL